jgi:transcription elongation GreA/GreB family factor
MSRAFVKEPDGDNAVEEFPERPISPHPNFVTSEGLAQIEATLADVEREHTAALAADDRNAIARTSRDLRYWGARRASAQVAAPRKDGQVHFGSTVTLLRDDGKRQTFRIVGEDEADPTHEKLSYVAPLARALMSKQVGDTVQAGSAEMEIVEIG